MMTPGLAQLENESQLVRRAAHEPEAFALIYGQNYAVILNYIYRRTLSVTTAEELTSNTFFKALRGLPKYRGDRPIRAWLYAIATNEIRMHRRWRRRHRVQPFDRPNDLAVMPSSAPAFESISKSLASLSHRHQTVIALRYFEKLELEQIAEVIGKPVGTVKSRLHRALARLKIALEAGGCHE